MKRMANIEIQELIPTDSSWNEVVSIAEQISTLNKRY